MKKYYLLIAITIFVIRFSNSQNIEIHNNITEKHTKIAGTKYSMIKPDSSFEISPNFIGFENKDLEAAINITEMPYPYEKVLSMFSKDIPPKNGELVFEKDYIINGYKVKLYKTNVIHKSAIENIADPESKGSAIIGWIMLSGNDSLCFILSGRYPVSKDNALSEKFEKSFISFIYEKDREINPLDGLLFSFNNDISELKFATVVMQTGALFNMDGKFPTESKDKSSYMVMVMPYSLEKDKMRDQAIKTMKKSLKDSIEVKEVNDIVVNKIQGVEVVGYGKNKTGEDKLSYVVIFFTPEKYFIIRANATIDLEKKLKLFKEFTRTFRLKE